MTLVMNMMKTRNRFEDIDVHWIPKLTYTDDNIMTRRKDDADDDYNLSGLTSLRYGQYLTSETRFFNLKHTHFGTHTQLNSCISLTLSKKVGKLFFSRF